jgi:hypothetical protein
MRTGCKRTATPPFEHDFTGTVHRFDLGNLCSTPVASSTGNIVGSAIYGVPAPGTAAVLGRAELRFARRGR